MIKARTITRALAGSAVAATAAVAMASPASAQPQITRLACDVGNQLVDCVVFHVGTVAPFTIRWSADNVAVPGANDRVEMLSSCTLNRIVGIRVTITDPTGTDTRSISRRCGPVIP